MRRIKGPKIDKKLIKIYSRLFTDSHFSDENTQYISYFGGHKTSLIVLVKCLRHKI